MSRASKLDDETRQRVGDFLRLSREAEGLNAKKQAEFLGISQNELYAYERGDASISAERAIGLMIQSARTSSEITQVEEIVSASRKLQEHWSLMQVVNSFEEVGMLDARGAPKAIAQLVGFDGKDDSRPPDDLYQRVVDYLKRRDFPRARNRRRGQ